ncbi:hypothetical protein [Armatimonas sp.]|uniref:hypothetical protein n=1 Tax=Armatimonas sp. TaxID=1872638 RepID=UPI003750310C
MATLTQTKSVHRPEAKGLFKVGDRVKFQRVLHWLEGVIVEDRGNIGIGGRRLYGIQVSVDPQENADDTLYFERPESDLAPL